MRARRLWICLLPLFALVAAACGDDDTGQGASTTTAPAAEELELVTYNAGLARGFVDLAEVRAAPVAEAIAQLDADLVALQEVWEPEDVDRVRAAATAAGFVEALFLDPSPEASGEPACHDDELAGTEACVRASCAEVPDDQLADCVLSSCGAEFGSLCETCQTCLAANVGQPLETVLETCQAGAARYAYGGSFGIGLLSRLPVLESDHLVLESSLNRRAVLYALVDAGPLGEVHVFATHLSAVFSDIPYPGEGTWAEEQAVQIRRLLELVDERAGAGEPVVVLGDLNTGPSTATLAGEVPENFQLLLEAGFEAPYLEADDPPCTFCADNPLVGGADDDASVAIDHILLRGLPAGSEGARILTEEVTVDGPEGPTATRLSDHYGVATTIRAAR